MKPTELTDTDFIRNTLWRHVEPPGCPHRGALGLGAVAKLQKATISFVTSVCLSEWNNSAPTGRIMMKLDILEFFFENLSRKFKFH